ncbi:type II toxin-antitoxin system VapC family toxin [Pseudomonas sp. R2.Fl]|nr:type II toxin-antitoxin system VapC family toxin [Pseudomonas sp. R2.Fl]
MLDTHVLAWWLLDDRRLSAPSRAAIAEGDNEIAASAVSAFEIATKYRLGKWPEAAQLAGDFEKYVMAERFFLLPISPSHALLAGQMTGHHKDPFDRLLAAQSKIETLVFVTADKAFDGFDIERLW